MMDSSIRLNNHLNPEVMPTHNYSMDYALKLVVLCNMVLLENLIDTWRLKC